MTVPIDALIRLVTGLAAPGGKNAGLAILMYHRVLATEDEISADVTADVFDAQMRGLRTHFSPLGLTEAVGKLERGSLPARAVCVTFDDGYRNNVDVALPILLRNGVPAAFFVATGFLGGGLMWNDKVTEAVRRTSLSSLEPGPWADEPLPLGTVESRREAVRRLLTRLKHAAPSDRENSVKRLVEHSGVTLPGDLMMREEDVRRLHMAGMEVGAHSVTHPILAKLPPDEAEREIVESGGRIAEILSRPTQLFAYPNGKPGMDYEPRHVDMVRKAGYRIALSTARGIARGKCDPLQIPRIAPWGSDARGFSVRLASAFREDRRSHRPGEAHRI
jgi:peptidoglycan/xylan/chitin deacetylase (PgdA/CDA1 family)